MAERENKRSYRVLLPIPGPGLMGTCTYADLGTAESGTAEASVAAVLDKLAPDVAADLDLSEAVAIPTGNWNECEVEEDPRPRFKVRRRETKEPERPDIDQADAAGLT